MRPFQYLAPETVNEAVEALNKHGNRAKPLAGGTDLLVQTRGDRFDLDAVVDMKRIPELMKLDVSSKGLTFGAAVPCYMLYENEKVSQQYPGIIDAASMIGGIQIQSRAGLVGNLCNSSPSADGICPLIVYKAQVNIAGSSGRRQIPVAEFCTGPGTNVLQRGEMVVSIEIPAPAPRSGAAYERFIPRNEMDIAVAGVAASVTISNDGQSFEDVLIALAAVGPVPIVVSQAADFLIGKEITDGNIRQAAAIAKEAARPIDDMRGTKNQRVSLVEVLTRRMLSKAVERARSN